MGAGIVQPVDEVANAILKSIDSTLESLDNNEIEEITIAEANPASIEIIRRVISQSFESTDEKNYSGMLEQHLDELKEMIVEDFMNHGYELDFELHPREIDELNIDEVTLHDVTSIDIVSISASLDSDVKNATFEVLAEIVFSAEFTEFDHDGFIREIHEDIGYPTRARLIPDQSVNVTVFVNLILSDDETSNTEIESIDLSIQEPILVNYQDVIFSRPDFLDDDDD
jgi:hypothetical protein